MYATVNVHTGAVDMTDMPKDDRESHAAESEDEWVFRDGRFVTGGPEATPTRRAKRPRRTKKRPVEEPPVEELPEEPAVEESAEEPTVEESAEDPPVEDFPAELSVEERPETPAAKRAPLRPAARVRKPRVKKAPVRKPPARKPPARKAPKVAARPSRLPAFDVPTDDGVPAPGETAKRNAARNSALIVVAASIGLGVVVQAIAFAIGRDASDALSRRITIGNLLVFGLYGAVALLIALEPNVRARMVDGSPGRAVASGIAVGLGAALVVVGFVSVLEGRWSSDRTILRVVSERNLPNVVLLAAIACVLAPLIEEFLFRGLLVESLRSRGRSSAVLAGAVAFAFWHLNPLALRYYVIVGMVLGLVYWRFGLAGSISAHATFNAALFAVAVLVLSAGSHVVEGGGIRIELPASWSVVESGMSSGVDLAAESMTGAELAVVHLDESVPGARQFVVPPNARLPHEIRVGEGTGTRFGLTTRDGEPSDVVVIQRDGRRWIVTLVPEGSTQAVRDFDAMIQTLMVPSG